MECVAEVSTEVGMLTQLALVQSSCARSLNNNSTSLSAQSEPLAAQLTELTS